MKTEKEVRELIRKADSISGIYALLARLKKPTEKTLEMAYHKIAIIWNYGV